MVDLGEGDDLTSKQWWSSTPKNLGSVDMKHDCCPHWVKCWNPKEIWSSVVSFFA